MILQNKACEQLTAVRSQGTGPCCAIWEHSHSGDTQVLRDARPSSDLPRYYKCITLLPSSSPRCQNKIPWHVQSTGKEGRPTARITSPMTWTEERISFSEDSSAITVRALQPGVGRYLCARKQWVQSVTACALSEVGDWESNKEQDWRM